MPGGIMTESKTPIWKNPVNLKEITETRMGSMAGLLGIEFIAVGDDFLSAKMPIDNRTKQPYGIMHGGASCVLAETIGSVAATCCVDPTFMCVGLDINTSHIRMVKEGYVVGTAKPINLGNRIHVWEIRIVDEMKRLISFTKFTVAVIETRK
jgi:1,4-dihydroxy-2-naphthoyl-CoA hydrolase